MVRRMLVWLCCGAASLGATAAAAQDATVGEKRAVTYNTLGLLSAPVVDVASDAANRVWVVTPGRVSAVLGESRVPLLPFTAAETGLPTGVQLRAAAFAVPAGNVADGEHFYLGASQGIAWGRLSSTVDFRGTLLFTSANPDPRNAVNALAAEGGNWLWAATDGGLVQWDLAAAAPTAPGDAEVFLAGSSHGAVRTVAAAPWGGVATTDGGHLHLVSAAGSETLVHAFASRVFGSIAFDGAGNLWAVTTESGTGILKYAVNSTADGLVAPPQEYPLNPANPPVGMRPTDLAVDRITGRVWVTVAGNQATAGRNAYHQLPDASGALASGAWEAVVNPFDTHTAVHADASGNTWLGMGGSSTEALNGYVVRLLTLDKNRYLGNATGTASLVDLALFGNNGTPGETATVTISVGTESREFPVTEQEDTGRFTQTFQIAPAGAAGGEGTLFLASSTPEGVAVEATYSFADANAVDRELSAAATWADTVDFEDDLWVGGGLCFLRSLGW